MKKRLTALIIAIALLCVFSAPCLAADSADDIKLIDMEHHYYAQDLLDYWATRTEIPTYDPEKGVEYAPNTWMGFPEPILDLGEGRIAEMDANHVAMAMLSSAPGLEIFGGEEEIEWCKRCNDLVYETMQKYPGRFYGSAILPVNNVEAAC